MALFIVKTATNDGGTNLAFQLNPLEILHDIGVAKKPTVIC